MNNVTEKSIKLITNKINNYHPKNGLDHISIFFLRMSSLHSEYVTLHTIRVSLLSERIAMKLKLDKKLSFFSGLLHDIGKTILPSYLFGNNEITNEEYEKIKIHVFTGAKILRDKYLFTSMCVGLHHAMYDKGYGLTIKDFPKNIGLANSSIKKILEVSSIVSIADFIEAFTHRETKLKDDTNEKNLKKLLYNKYPNDLIIVDIALKEYPKIKHWRNE